MGFFRKKKAKVVEKTATQKLNEEIKNHAIKIENLERLKPRLNKLIIHYKKQLHKSSRQYVSDNGMTLTFAKGYEGYPDGFFAFADKTGLDIEPLCASRYSYEVESSFIVKAKEK